MIFNVTRTDDFIFKKTDSQRKPILEKYSLKVNIEDMDDLFFAKVEYPDGLTGLLSSFQPFTKLGELLKARNIREPFKFDVEIDREHLAITLLDKKLISEKICDLKSSVMNFCSKENIDDIEGALGYLFEYYEKYIIKDIEQILLPPLIKVDLEEGCYERPGFFEAEAIRIEKDEDFVYFEAVNGTRLVQNLFGASLRKMLNDFESFELVIDASKDLHVSYCFWEIDRQLNIATRFINLYRANSKLTDKKISVKIESTEMSDFLH